MLSTGANVFICIYCYHLVLSCDVIILDDNTPLFYFSWKLHSLDFYRLAALYLNLQVRDGICGDTSLKDYIFLQGRKIRAKSLFSGTGHTGTDRHVTEKERYNDVHMCRVWTSTALTGGGQLVSTKWIKHNISLPSKRKIVHLNPKIKRWLFSISCLGTKHKPTAPHTWVHYWNSGISLFQTICY
jgi:hypothetical protein